MWKLFGETEGQVTGKIEDGVFIGTGKTEVKGVGVRVRGVQDRGHLVSDK